jgi:hypothetical protein
MSLGRCVKLAEIEARLCSRGPPYRIDFDLFHPRQIDYEAIVAHRCSADVMAAGAHRNQQGSRARKLDRLNNIIGAGAEETTALGRRSIIPFQTRRA